MNTRILNTPQAPKPATPVFPALYRNKHYGHIYFASDERNAVVIVTSDHCYARAVGYRFDAGAHGTLPEATQLERIEGPLAVEFQSTR